ncbi:MAG: sigma-70 family RNA polymerase sigma factor [Solirubrobacterales bacterium]
MYRQAVAEELTRAQFDAARLGFVQLLRRKRMSPQFIERHGEDLFAQACFEFSRQLAEGKRIDNPVAWLITCGWHRTVGLLEARDWQPRVVSTERVGELGNEAQVPEETFLAGDRYRKVRDAVNRLPAYQRRLLALSYFEGESVREAARRLNWTPSKGQRAHEAAQRKLRKLLPVETSDELEIGLAAFLSLAGGGSRVAHIHGGIEAVAEAAVHRATQVGDRALDLARRAFGHGGAPGSGGRAEAAAVLGRASSEGHGPLAMAARGGRRAAELGRRLVASGGLEASGAATEGGGRAVEVCKAAIAVCLVGGSAVTGVLLGPSQHHGRPGSHRPEAAAQTSQRSGVVAGRETGESALPGGASETNATEASAAGPVSESGGQRAAADASAKPAARRARRHREEEASAEGQFSAFARAAGGGSETLTQQPAAHTSSTGAASTGEAGESGSESSSGASSAEEEALHHQFREGLP